MHARVSKYQATPQECAARAKELLAERIEKGSRVHILNAIRKKLPATFSLPDLEMVALDYFERLGHDNHRRLCRLYGWPEKKSRNSWGGNSVDYKSIVEKALAGMSTQDVQHFLVVCSLVSDIYCPSNHPRQSLSRDSNLTRSAARYKIDTARLTIDVRTELSKKKKQGKGPANRQNTGKTAKPK